MWRKVKPGSTIDITWDSFAAATGASSSTSNLAVGDVNIYKDAGMTQRGSTSGFTLIDTDGLDVDSFTGINWLTIDLSDNTTADFYAAGSRYVVVVGPITIDGQTVNFIADRFIIGYEGSILDTTIATLASQTSFTITNGPADNNALVGCIAIVHDAASAIQVAIGVVSAYTGSTKTVTLAADPGIFTMAAKDNISFFLPTNVKSIGQTAQTGLDLGSANLGDTGVGLAKLAEMFAAFVAGKVARSSAMGVTTLYYKKRDGSTTSFSSVCDEDDGDRATTGSLS